MTSSISRGLAQGNVEHPFIEQKDIKSETCLTCHPEKKQGKYIHTAVGMGCENCHQATSENAKTTVTLIATGGDLCAMCHEAKKDSVLHGPYKQGQCLVCHDAHTSDFPNQARAATNKLCLGCHGEDQPDVKANAATRSVALLGNQKLGLDDYRRAPKIGLDRSGITGHPVAGHPLTGKDPRIKEGTITCLSCHSPHNSTLPSLIVAVRSGKDVCDTCHQALEPRKLR